MCLNTLPISIAEYDGAFVSIMLILPCAMADSYTCAGLSVFVFSMISLDDLQQKVGIPSIEKYDV